MRVEAEPGQVEGSEQTRGRIEAAQSSLRQMSYTVMMMHKNERPGVTKQPTPWYTAGAQPKHGIIPTRGGKDSNSKEPKVKCFYLH